MKTVQHMLDGKRTQLSSISPDASVYDALSLMAALDIGALVVLRDDHLAGIFSERDYARKIILHGKSSRDTLVKEVMTEKVLCVQPAQTVEECMALMTAKRVRHLPVLKDKKVIGVISIGDVVKEMIQEQKQIIEQLESYIHH
jgi:CBS domain-containing protein